ncbi:uncharacterized protein LOC120693979 isoform X4 [Panicum virgatum]|uniref:uncharacterized protein LOC120693979 isoform X4 n=1 Tax=Panicum virgatum TaxID=38727 RepID=UPI0019D68097|nr:uncharacterized protein LOC120693979 isoform X4 [Panicum virgatum]
MEFIQPVEAGGSGGGGRRSPCDSSFPAGDLSILSCTGVFIYSICICLQSLSPDLPSPSRCHYMAICQNSAFHFEKLQSGLTSLLFSTNLRGSASEVSAQHPELRVEELGMENSASNLSNI